MKKNVAVVLVLGLSPAFAATSEFTVVPERGAYTLNDERQIHPTNQRSDLGQVDLENPTPYAVTIWAVENREQQACAPGDTKPTCKATALYVLVAKETAPPRRFAFHTRDGFQWWVKVIRQRAMGDGSSCVHLVLEEEVRSGNAMPASGWPRRATEVCVGPAGFVGP
jgi:hypothetical protein